MAGHDSLGAIVEPVGGGDASGDVDNLDQQEPPDFDDALDYDEDETDGLFYRQGDNFIKIWDASVASHETPWGW